MSIEDKRRDLGLQYLDAMHGVQSAIKYEMEAGVSDATSPKHLRVGVDSSMINVAAVACLLIEKGVFTLTEYEESVRLQANEELAAYQAAHPKITFR